MFKLLRALVLIVLGLALFSPFCSAQAQLVGDWEGSFTTHGRELHFILHIDAQKDGTLAATLDVPEVKALAMQASAVSLKGSTFGFVVESVHGSYEGTVNPNATEITGAWSESDSIGLDFKRKPKDTPPAQ